MVAKLGERLPVSKQILYLEKIPSQEAHKKYKSIWEDDIKIYFKNRLGCQRFY
jgi:hypothetical protein